MTTTEHTVLCSDCMDAMRAMGDGAFDSIVTDPPYGLAFMGAEWDSFGSDTRQPGDEHYVTPDNPFGRSKVRYGYGKNVGKSMVAYQERMTPVFEEALRVAKSGAYMLCFGGTRTFHRLMCAIEDAGWEIRDTIMWVYGSGFPHGMDVGRAIDKALGAEAGSDEAAKWAGWNTALKPAWEPIIVARKPLDGTVAHNVMTHGVGAMNVDACRVDSFSDGPHSTPESSVGGRRGSMAGPMGRVAYDGSKGRFPANLVHDGCQEVLELFPDKSGRNSDSPQSHRDGPKNCYGDYGDVRPAIRQYDQQGNAARFFYCAKASKSDRGEGNDHPTVKPNALMRWLVRLVTPEGGLVLDPFMGSGSTGVAAAQEGMSFVGIDSDPHYCEIAAARIEGALA